MKLLEVKDLNVSFKISAGRVLAVNGVSFSLDEGKVLGIVGESGSGKSVTAYSIMQILDKNGNVDSGEILFKGQNILQMNDEEKRQIRGDRISIIFQDAMTGLNPVWSIGNQIIEAILTHAPETPKEEAYQRAVKMLNEVGITDPEKRMKQYPFQLSGGMLQRVMIAMALVQRPDILIADEPTTALDVTIQAQILDLLKRLQKEYGMAIIIITHDLGVIAQMCDEVDIMYAGRIVERGNVDDIFYNPKHEYTKGLLNSMPKLDDKKERLDSIAGNPVDLFCLPKGCAFSSRCASCMKICIDKFPEEVVVDETGHAASCWKMIKERYDNKEIDIVNGNPEGTPLIYNGAIISNDLKGGKK